MTIVVDANVAVHWTIASPHSENAERLLRSGVPLIAPDFIIVEVTNAFFSNIREREDRVERALDGLEFLPRWFAELVPATTLRHRAMAYCLELAHPAYDCYYLALAESRRVQFVTTDEHFLRKVKRFPSHARSVVRLADWKP
ncbi:MAG: type II toxin-antitoxin system VapC family toxin [Rhizobiales bacterium]|nr:type II toxin-antitoxin system VapC family toxin [Hyphomicrobiales bacterium]